VLGLTWAGLNVHQLLDLKGQERQAIAQTQAEQAKYQELTRSYPPSPAPPARLKLTVEVASQIAANARLPEQAFRAVSRALDANPEIELTGLTWRLDRQVVPPGSPPGQLVQVAKLQLQTMTKPSDHKALLAGINKLLKDLNGSELVSTARTVKLPVNLASSAKLSGSTANPLREQPQLAQFEVEVALKPGV
jgi:hypothetical protein